MISVERVVGCEEQERVPAPGGRSHGGPESRRRAAVHLPPPPSPAPRRHALPPAYQGPQGTGEAEIKINLCVVCLWQRKKPASCLAGWLSSGLVL